MSDQHSPEEAETFAKAHAGETLTAATYTENKPVRVIGWGRAFGLWWIVCETDRQTSGSKFSPMTLVVDGYDESRLNGYSVDHFPNLPAKLVLDRSRFPHVCPKPGCGKPAYVGFNSVDCSAGHQ